jgi:hypothetical protein
MARDTRRVEIDVDQVVRLVVRDKKIQDKIVSKLSSYFLNDMILSCLEKVIKDNSTDASKWEERGIVATFNNKANSYIAMSNTKVKKAKEREKRYKEIRKMFINALDAEL